MSLYVSAVMVIVLLRYAHVIEKHQNCILNTASLSTGWICAAGLIMVGNFQVRKQSEVPSMINSDEKEEQNLHSLTERTELRVKRVKHLARFISFFFFRQAIHQVENKKDYLE